MVKIELLDVYNIPISFPFVKIDGKVIKLSYSVHRIGLTIDKFTTG